MGVDGQCHGLTTLPPGKGCSTHCTGDQVGLRASLNVYRKPHPNILLQWAGYHVTEWAIFFMYISHMMSILPHLQSIKKIQ